MIRLGYWAVGLLLHGVVVAASAENALTSSLTLKSWDSC